MVDQCRFSSWDLSDLEYIRLYVFNKAEYIRFNSTVGKFVGYNEYGVYNAEQWNKDPGILDAMRVEKDRYCRPSAQIDINNILTKKGQNTTCLTVEPVVKLRLGKPSSGDKPAVLMCSAYDFYPKMIKLTWYRDDKKVTGDVVSSEELADGDWHYQIHSHLEFTPKAGEKIICVVEHTSFNEPKQFVWDSSMPEAERNKVVIGAAGLMLGLVVCAAGLLYYRKTSQG
ncbi:hypothetical protein ACEWY4_011927 [Coilia grayii]|uniref:Ig-like domain-containing protein n=1 Tax=Coilia grayii TaxID=363190 RepID=A0ABD1JZ21_9TELE